MQLRRKFLLSLLLVGLVIGGVMVVTFESQRSDAIADAQSGVDERAVGSAATIDQQLQQYQQTIRIAADDPRLRNHGSDEQRASLDGVRNLDGIGGASVVDGDGVMVELVTAEGERPDGVVGQEYTDREYVVRALAGEEYVSDPVDAATGNRIVVLSVPIYEDGEVVGTLNAALYLDGGFFASAIGPQDEEMYIAVTAGTETLFEGRPGFDAAISSSATVQSTGWEVTVDRQAAAVTEQIQRLALVQVALTLVLFAAVGGFGGWIYRNHIRQTERLQTRLERLEHRQYDEDLPLTGSPEWVEISGAVDRLAATLDRREQMLLVLNRLLRHNLRNTLNVILGRAHALDAAAAGEITDACDQLLRLSDRARMTEKLLMRAADERTSVVDVVETVERQVATFEDQYADATVTIDAPESLHATVGPDFATAVDEILTNAGEHAGPSPSVDVELRQDADVAELTISDDGDCIPPEERSVLSGERRISHLHHTGGLGLWLVDWIVAQSDGTVEISCDSGTTVRLRVPVADSGELGRRTR